MILLRISRKDVIELRAPLLKALRHCIRHCIQHNFSIPGGFAAFVQHDQFSQKVGGDANQKFYFLPIELNRLLNQSPAFADVVAVCGACGRDCDTVERAAEPLTAVVVGDE